MRIFVGLCLALAVALVTIAVAMGNTKQMRLVEELVAIMGDLDNLNGQETGSFQAGQPSPEAEAIEGVCQAIVQATSVPYDDDFNDAVQRTLLIWNRCLGIWYSKLTYAEWDYSTNLIPEMAVKSEEIQTDVTKWTLSLARAAQRYKNDVRYVTLDFDVQRQIRLLAFSTDPTNPDDIKDLVEVGTRLEEAYSTAKVGNLSLEPDLEDVMKEETDPGLLLAAWWAWRNATGPRMIDDYEKLVQLLNKGAQENNFTSYAEAWTESQFDETPDLESRAESLWQELEPLYKELHAYVRERLRTRYARGSRSGPPGDDDEAELSREMEEIFASGGIPAHLTGDMWAQTWQNIYDLVKPYDIPEVDYDAQLLTQGYDVDKLFSTAEEFYTSIGLYPMTENFNRYSMKVKPADGTEVVCHASASDFYSSDDFRIKMCTEVNMNYFETIHHEMGHIEYFMAYSQQPTIYRDGANSAFHEAIGDTVSLSVLSQQHMRALGLDPDTSPKDDMVPGDKKVNGKTSISQKRTINYLMKKALFKIAFLPFGYMIDKWRWDVFRGNVTKENYNKHWWQLRLKYQGIVAPVPRSGTDFDPAAKYHIPSNSPYICYFISFIIQFQFYEAMCDISGHQGELYDCDFFQSEEAGGKLLEMLRLGKSVPWPDAMEVLTGARDISTQSILRYFRPLYDWLRKENKKNGVEVGWKNAKINWNE